MSNFIQLLRKSISDLGRYPLLLLVAWLVVILSLPLLNVIFGQQTLLQGLELAVLLQVAFVLNVLYRAWGWWSMIRAAVGVVLLAWAVQAIVIRSGLPYGDMQYTSLLQPQVMSVPLLIPFTWLMMLPPAWAVAKLITRRLSGCLMRPAFVLVSALAFTAWGFILDPLMVHLGLLQWKPVGGFFGTPWLNYIGWLLVSAVITFGISPKRLPGGSLVLVYGLTWLAEFIAVLIFWGSPVPAVVVFILMGGMLLWAGIITQ
jgi:uncharacterized membrane protein